MPVDDPRLSLPFVAVGVLFVVLGVLHARRLRRFLASAERVPGTVVGLQYRSDGDGSGIYYPQLRFVTVDGREIETVGMYGRRPAPARTGDRVEVLYDPADPRRATLPRGGGLVIAVVFVLLGALAVAVGLGVSVLPRLLPHLP